MLHKTQNKPEGCIQMASQPLRSLFVSKSRLDVKETYIQFTCTKEISKLNKKRIYIYTTLKHYAVKSDVCS